FVSGPSEVPTCCHNNSSAPRPQRISGGAHFALDGAGAAEGTLYLDDGESFDYTTDQGHALRRFTYANGTLSATGVSGLYQPGNAIERIVIIGMVTEPTAITAGDEQLDFRWMQATSELVIRKPGVLVASDFVLRVRS
ncbi:hypothetical protein JKP88DRAFT_318336, partial [Tribonema minus]